MTHPGATWGSVAAMLIFGCSDGIHQPLGPELPIRVHDGKGNYAQYVGKPLPGTQPKTTSEASAGAGGETSSDAQPAGPVVNYETAMGWVYQGQSNAKFTGRLSADAVAVGIAVPDVEKGYWVRSAGDPDVTTQELTWEAYLDVSESVEPGYHDVVFVGIDADGNAGQKLPRKLCVRSRVPDNFNACSPSADAPEAVISLKWDANVDLDLQVIDPDGNVIDSKNSDALSVKGTVNPNAGVIDRDSNAGCAIDGIRYENLYWNTVAPKGRYGIYVNLFDSCRQPVVHFQVSVYSAKSVADAGRTLKEYYSQSGVLMDYQANAGVGRGLFITEFDFK